MTRDEMQAISAMARRDGMVAKQRHRTLIIGATFIVLGAASLIAQFWWK